MALLHTIHALLMRQQIAAAAAATNTNTTPPHADDDDDDGREDDDEGDDGFVDHDSIVGLRRRAPDTLDFNRKRRNVSVKFQLPEKEAMPLNEIIEECEYDSDVGKFRCKDDEALEESENSSTSSMVDHYMQVEQMNDLNSPLKCINRTGLDVNNLNADEELLNKDDEQDEDLQYKIVMKRIEFFESNGRRDQVDGGTTSSNNSSNLSVDSCKRPTSDENRLSIILFTIFIVTVALLIIFPLPNY